MSSKTVSLEGYSRKEFFNKRRELSEETTSSPLIYTTEDKDISYRIDDRVYVDMNQFIRKMRNGDFAVVEDNDGTLVGHSKFMFIK